MPCLPVQVAAVGAARLRCLDRLAAALGDLTNLGRPLPQLGASLRGPPRRRGRSKLRAER